MGAYRSIIGGPSRSRPPPASGLGPREDKPTSLSCPWTSSPRPGGDLGAYRSGIIGGPSRSRPPPDDTWAVRLAQSALPTLWMTFGTVFLFEVFSWELRALRAA